MVFCFCRSLDIAFDTGLDFFFAVIDLAFLFGRSARWKKLKFPFWLGLL